MNKWREDLRLWFNYTIPKNHHEAAIIAIHVFASELGFSFEAVENLRIILNKNSEHSVLNYRNNKISIKSKFCVKYVNMANCAMIFAFVGRTLVNSMPIRVDQLIKANADFDRFDTIYHEPNFLKFSTLVKDEYLLKMIAESQYEENVPQTFGITLLPVHCLELIMLNLDLKDIGVCSRVNKTFKEAFDSQSFWRKLYQRDFNNSTEPISYWKQSFKDRIEQDRRNRLRTANLNSKAGRARLHCGTFNVMEPGPFW